MSFNFTINFDSFEQLNNYIEDLNKYKKWKEKKENKKIDEIATSFDIKEDKRGKHQQEYHNLAKIYQNQNPTLSYRECLKIVYKNNKSIEKIL